MLYIYIYTYNKCPCLLYIIYAYIPTPSFVFLVRVLLRSFCQVFKIFSLAFFIQLEKYLNTFGLDNWRILSGNDILTTSEISYIADMAMAAMAFWAIKMASQSQTGKS